MTPTLQEIEARANDLADLIEIADSEAHETDPALLAALKDIRTLLALCKQSQTWVAIETEQPKTKDEIVALLTTGEVLIVTPISYNQITKIGVAEYDISTDGYTCYTHWFPIPPLPSIEKGG